MTAIGAGPISEADLLVGIRDTPLSVEECLAAVTRPAAGGVGLFVGVVRESDHGRPVVDLEYSAHPDALDRLREVAQHIAGQFPVAAIAAVHRVGRLDIGEIAVIVAVSCPHRGEAMDAAHRLIDDLKSTVPIWKQQTYSDGETEWVGCA